MAGVLAEILGHQNRAVELYQKSLDDDPLNAAKHFNLGAALFGSERHDEAQVEFLKALELNSKLLNTRLLLGQSLLLQGHPEEALKEFNNDSDEENRLIGRALVYYRLGRIADSDLEVAPVV
jgi:tetratricopeptide (TPR) repeat protein